MYVCVCKCNSSISYNEHKSDTKVWWNLPCTLASVFDRKLCDNGTLGFLDVIWILIPALLNWKSLIYDFEYYSFFKVLTNLL